MTIPQLLTGGPFPARANSLNLFRLLLAGLVLFAHAWYTAGEGVGPTIQGENLGGWAVAGFFVISGFLITTSRFTNSAGDFLVHRIARIFPAFIVCLVVMAFVFAPIAAIVERGTLAGFLTTPTTPLEFIWGNSGLKMRHYDISGTLTTVPYPSAWNGSLWTLYYEFLCYLIIWLLGSLAIVRRSPVVVAAVFVLSVIIHANIDFARRLGLNEDFVLLMRLLPYFMGGALVYYVIARFGLSPFVGIASLVVAAGLIATIPGWGGQLSAPFMAYGLLYLSTVVPQPRFIAKNDVSYGFYIYAWPMQQLLMLPVLSQYGMAVYIGVTAVLTAVLAYLSWILIERPVMRLAKGKPRPVRSKAVASV
ncbi:acyltransferase family protein [Agromyces cerinus]|uniref:Peptidoglycan/LPS O-acetylase OafA/YrhL, contains acyltransferase and SGNH-hydrolase domains n=1 Tax=Agromyces cerinus subsp. cerinus TaxID=232089 RepID=A0A1N6DHY8_9MICO|nr:acyltransferase [Agromyces cerinus]SIN70439.1 Peptidoglycan/LPS O-acetylase OafA/YrhL, contains acyltransferase and SGNH-hydrolase domains [Agromyces cerinus subsp. cerinus]